MDVKLPDMRGFDAAKLIRQDENTRDIPTASVMADDKTALNDITNSGFIGKPINTRTFVNELRQYIK
jgi:two-component system cell cycle response regulator DivK